MMQPIALPDAGEGHFADAAARIVDQVAREGYAKVKLSAADAEALRRLRQEVERFFTSDESAKQLHACPNFVFGFRPFGRQYSTDPSRPDLNESFTYWSDEPSHIPAHEKIPEFTSALHGYWQVVSGLVRGMMDDIAARYSYPHRIDLERASYIETNWYRSKETRDLLQDRHEDGHLLTLVHADARGLEIEIGGEMQPVQFAEDEVVVMPGGLMTRMTGGWIQPLYHQVRNYGLPKRSAILFLVNPPVDEQTAPFVADENTGELDIAALTRTTGHMFGLPDAPVEELSKTSR